MQRLGHRPKYLALAWGRRHRSRAGWDAARAPPLQSPQAQGPHALAQGARLAQLGRNGSSLPLGQGEVGHRTHSAQGLQGAQGTRHRAAYGSPNAQAADT